MTMADPMSRSVVGNRLRMASRHRCADGHRPAQVEGHHGLHVGEEPDEHRLVEAPLLAKLLGQREVATADAAEVGVDRVARRHLEDEEHPDGHDEDHRDGVDEAADDEGERGRKHRSGHTMTHDRTG